MLFLVSGASRSGKTQLAKKILGEKGIPYLSIDWLMMGFNDGMPEQGIHHLLWPDDIAEQMAPFLLGMIDSLLADDVDYLIEGEALLPKTVAGLIAQHPAKIRAVFLGYACTEIATKVDLIKQHEPAGGDWLTRQSDHYIADHVGNMIAHSKRIKAACTEHGLSYFDTGANFCRSVDAAADFLIGDSALEH